jgi:hypothetical protein
MKDKKCPSCGDDSVIYRGHTVIHCANPECEHHVEEVDVESDMRFALLEAPTPRRAEIVVTLVPVRRCLRCGDPPLRGLSVCAPCRGGMARWSHGGIIQGPSLGIVGERATESVIPIERSVPPAPITGPGLPETGELGGACPFASAPVAVDQDLSGAGGLDVSISCRDRASLTLEVLGDEVCERVIRGIVDALRLREGQD